MITDSLSALRPYIEVLGLVSVFTFVLSLVIIPIVIGRLPEHYFLKISKKTPSTGYKRGGIALLAIGNLFGILLFLAGFLMLFLPGQGLLTMIIGLIFMSFPGKQILINRLTRNASVQKSLNWARRKMSKPPFLWQ